MSIKIATINTFTAAPEPLRFCGQRMRLNKMVKELQKLEGGSVDVFILTECIVPSVVEDLLQPLAKAGWPFCTKPLLSRRVFAQNGMPPVMNGGVFIMSRWPMLQEDQHIFENTIGADGLAAKGVVYGQILKEGKRFHIFGTHLQAWKTTEARTIRIQQSLEIRAFVRRQNIAGDEPVLFGGDINIDRDSQFVDLQNFLHVTDMNMPPIAGKERHTVSKNNQLYGVDDPSQYTNESWPTGCYDVYLDTLRCPCCAEAWLDYIFTSRAHQLPVPSTSTLRAVPLKVKPYNLQISLNTWRTVTDITDHYAVVGDFTFQDNSTSRRREGSPAPVVGGQLADAADVIPSIIAKRHARSVSHKRHAHQDTLIQFSMTPFTTIVIGVTLVILLAFILLWRRRRMHL